MCILLQVKGNGDCLFENFVKQVIFNEENGHKKYKACHLRRQALVHFIHNCGEKEYKDCIIKQVRELYGSGEEDGTWGENIMLGLIASMWGVRFSILLSALCAEVRLRYNMEWPECDFSLLFNCNSRIGHYSGVRRNDETGVECKNIKEGQDYSSEEDRREKSKMSVPQGIIVVSVSKLQRF